MPVAAKRKAPAHLQAPLRSLRGAFGQAAAWRAGDLLGSPDEPDHVVSLRCFFGAVLGTGTWDSMGLHGTGKDALASPLECRDAMKASKPGTPWTQEDYTLAMPRCVSGKRKFTQ